MFSGNGVRIFPPAISNALGAAGIQNTISGVDYITAFVGSRFVDPRLVARSASTLKTVKWRYNHVRPTRAPSRLDFEPL